jgi:membrane protease YdiL (CAAX protease family)
MVQFIPEKQKKKLRNITILIVYAIAAFWFLINGSKVFNNWDDSWTYTTLFYIVGVSLFLSVQDKLPRDLEKPISDHIFGFCIAAPLTLLFLVGLYDSGVYFQDITQLPNNLVIPTLIYQLVIVSASEEIIFRGIIFRFLHQYHWMIAWLVSAMIFSVFHYAVYQSLSAFIVAFILGIIFAWVVERWNLGVSIAIHWSWNIFILGAIIPLISW